MQKIGASFNVKRNGGDVGDRTPDLRLAKPALYQLSYIPEGVVMLLRLTLNFMVGLGGIEPPTSRLSGVRSNRLSYRPTPNRALGAL